MAPFQSFSSLLTEELGFCAVDESAEQCEKVAHKSATGSMNKLFSDLVFMNILLDINESMIIINNVAHLHTVVYI